MTAPAPSELALMRLDPSVFVKADARSWRGPCPRCGGHRRLLVFTDHPFPKWHCICDMCGFKAWADQMNHELKNPITDQQRIFWAAKEQAARAERETYRRQRMAEFSAQEVWEEYHERMNEAQREYWRQAGIPDAWQNYYGMGYVASKLFDHNGEKFFSPAYTIPIFDFGRKPLNMQYRIEHPPAGVGRYRQEFGLPAAAFLSNTDDPLGDECVIVEGAKKAAVWQIHVDASPLVIGIPGVRSWAGVPEKVQACGRVWIALDPDAGQAAQDLAKAIGPGARIVTLPVKPDDLLIQYGGTAGDIRRAMKEAVRAC